MEWEHATSESKSSQFSLLQNNGELISKEIPHSADKTVYILIEREREI